MGGIPEFIRQVQPGEVQPLVQLEPPARAIRDIIHNALEGHKFARATLTVIPA